jgi:protein ImuA
MHAVFEGQDLVPPSLSPPSAGKAEALPPAVQAAVWRGSELGSPVTATLGTGWPSLDAELPGGGWPCRSLTEVLQPQPSVCEWRLLAPALRQVVTRGQSVVVVGAPKTPHLPGLRHDGIDEAHLIRVQADSPAHRLWSTEQLVRANACGAVLAWLPQARTEQLRRLQVLAQSCDGPVFLFRPEAARHEASPAPLRVLVTYGLDWVLHLQVLKRKGPHLEDVITLPSVPGGLNTVLTPRLRTPSRWLASRHSHESADALGRPVARPTARRRVVA